MLTKRRYPANAELRWSNAFLSSELGQSVGHLEIVIQILVHGLIDET
jgi:hypothetical protein